MSFLLHFIFPLHCGSTPKYSLPGQTTTCRTKGGTPLLIFSSPSPFFYTFPGPRLFTTLLGDTGLPLPLPILQTLHRHLREVRPYRPVTHIYFYRARQTLGVKSTEGKISNRPTIPGPTPVRVRGRTGGERCQRVEGDPFLSEGRIDWTQTGGRTYVTGLRVFVGAVVCLCENHRESRSEVFRGEIGREFIT